MRRGRYFFVFLLAILLLSISSYQMIPWGGRPGVDFQNLHAFHHCAHANAPYKISGFDCGDVLGREMLYPPALYWSFAWVRALDLDRAYAVWVVILSVLSLACVLAWCRSERARPRAVLLSFLLLPQLPLAYAIERGNNDVLVLGLWSLAAWAASRKRVLASGALAGACAALKVYPALAVALTAAGALGACASSRTAKWSRWTISAGSSFGVLALLAPQSWIYWTQVLPRFAGEQQIVDMTNHSIRTLFIDRPVIAWSLQGVLFIGVALGLRYASKRNDFSAIFALSLAASTYFSSTSNDYNLLTAYPLLVLCICREWNAAAVLGVLAVIGHRYWYFNSVFKSAEFHTLIQVFWLLYVGWTLARVESRTEQPSVA